MMGKSVKSSSTFVWSVIILIRLSHPGNQSLLEDIDELDVLEDDELVELEEVELELLESILLLELLEFSIRGGSFLYG